MSWFGNKEKVTFKTQEQADRELREWCTHRVFNNLETVLKNGARFTVTDPVAQAHHLYMWIKTGEDPHPKREVTPFSFEPSDIDDVDFVPVRPDTQTLVFGWQHGKGSFVHEYNPDAPLGSAEIGETVSDTGDKSTYEPGDMGSE